ncbi:myb-like protein A [Frieseomelitta varia]|uniref:myb-like protein A n=1 Tax=Frieseomelitta varia TaxID=561572 RepID=UPI001CB6B6A6|nr:myb-like protein A [Frieseomelitta varia]
MIIVLFHVLYLFGKFVYQNYRNKQKAIDDDVINTEVQLNISEEDYNMRDPEAPQDFERKPITFSPPLYMQRYRAVQDILSSEKYEGKIRKIADIGCGNFGFFNYMKRTPGIEEILCVDVNESVLDFHKKVAPLISEYINRRPTPLVVEIYKGCVTENDKKLENTDAVICIELIEHLHPSTLAKVPQNIFGFIRPKVAVITTPNADFNVLFSNVFRFRHYDHKFEWTRQQFQKWATNITLKYPSYTVTFEGIGKGPEGSEHLGCCTQMAVFHRIYEFEFCNPGIENLFKLITRYDYPFKVDNRSDEQKILDDATYYIRYLSYEDPELEQEIPLHTLLPMLYNFRISVIALQVILEEAGWLIENRESGPVVIVPPVSDSESSIDDWNPEVSPADEDWNSEHGPHIDFQQRHLEQSSSNVLDNEIWNEEPSIVIPQNNSIIEDNINLYDEENVLLSNESETTRNTEISVRSEINNEENLDPILGTDNFNNSFDNNDASYVNESTELSDSSSTKKFEDFYTSDTQNNATSSTTFKLNRTLDLPIYMSVSRASTSPEPYLLDAVKMDCHLENNSMSSQSNYWMLNNSLDQENVSINSTVDVNDEKNKKSSLKHNFNNCIHLHNNYLNTSYKEDENSDSEANAEANCFSQNQIQSVQEDINTSESNSYLEDELQSNPSSVMFANSIPLDNQPQFTSSPKVEIKVNSINKKRRSLDYKEEKNSTNSLNITQKYELTNPSSDNLLENRDEVLHNNNDINITTILAVNSRDICTADNSDISTYQDDIKKKSENELINNSNQDTLISSNIATISCTLNENLFDANSLHSNNSMKNHKTLETETKEILAEEQKEFLANTNNIQSVNYNTKIELMIKSKSYTEFINDTDGKTELKPELHDDCDLCVKNVNSTKMSHAKDISNLENITLVSDHAKNTRDIESTSVLKSKKLIEYNAENHESKCKNINPNIGEFELKPSPETVESPPNSWSQEVMDSGYPNSASAQDMTPEYDLSSIAPDHISDSESPSIAEAPRLEIADVIEVENGDLANNNRDGEGNNMMAAELNNLEDLQPLIEVLENDIENENDIYAVENDFPIWLLRILNMANPVEVDIHIQDHRELVFPNRVAGDNARYVNMERDEGFDSSSEENSDLENNEMRDNVNDANENDNENASNSDSGSEQWIVNDT